jgi:hypothetical protein
MIGFVGMGTLGFVGEAGVPALGFVGSTGARAPAPLTAPARPGAGGTRAARSTGAVITAPHSPQNTTGPTHSLPQEGHFTLGWLTRADLLGAIERRQDPTRHRKRRRCSRTIVHHGECDDDALRRAERGCERPLDRQRPR